MSFFGRSNFRIINYTKASMIQVGFQNSLKLAILFPLILIRAMNNWLYVLPVEVTKALPWNSTKNTSGLDVALKSKSVKFEGIKRNANEWFGDAYSSTVCNTSPMTVEYELTPYSDTLSELITVCMHGVNNTVKRSKDRT